MAFEARAATSPGMLVYGISSQETPRYRTWDGSDLSSESSASRRERRHGEAVFIDVVSGTTRREEKILVEQTDNGHIGEIVWNGSSWSNGGGAPTDGDFTTDVPGETKRAYGVAYEQLSGDALVVYESNQGDNTDFGYAIWNGAAWRTSTFDYAAGCEGVMGGPIEWIKVAPRPRSDQILVWISFATSKDAYALIWDGSTFGNCAQVSDNVGTISTASHEDMGLGWEAISGDAMIVWCSSTVFNYRTFSGGIWSGGAALDMLNPCQGVSLAGDPTSNHVALIGADLQATNDVAVAMWNGSEWIESVPAVGQTGIVTATAAPRIGVTWETTTGQALFAIASEHSLVYFVYDRAEDAWTCPKTSQRVTDLDYAEGANGPCSASNVHARTDRVGPVRFASDPDSSDIILMTANFDSQDIGLKVLKWTGETNTFSAPPNSETPVVGTAFAFAFDHAAAGNHIGTDSGTSDPGDAGATVNGGVAGSGRVDLSVGCACRPDPRRDSGPPSFPAVMILTLTVARRYRETPRCARRG